jgi:hypothetical protein
MLSDHNPLVTQVDVSFKANKTKRWHFNMTLLQNELSVAEFQFAFLEKNTRTL